MVLKREPSFFYPEADTSLNHYYSYRSFLKKKFGKPVIKIPVNGGFSCPNRDGTKSTVGCLFCDNRSFSPVAHLLEKSPREQLVEAISRIRKVNVVFLPYLQPFSNTYGNVEALRSVYEPLLEVDRVIGLAIGTRPDCFSETVYSYLAELSKRTYLSIELGLQSSHDGTLAASNRGHTYKEFTEAVYSLSRLGIESVAHVMLGLPGETPEMMVTTAQRLAELPLTGVKIHQLMIITGTEYEALYKKNEIRLFSVDEYAEVLSAFLRHLRPDQHIHRIVANSTVENGLIAPEWSADKMGTLHTLQHYLNSHAVRQGEWFRS